MKRNIAVITGTRADYGIYYWILKEIDKDPELQLQLIACGMHLSQEFGMTINEIERDGFIVEEKVETLLSSDTGAAMAKSIGLSIINFTQSFERLKPDILLILGDRGEMIAGAIAAIHMNIPIAHIHGGEVTGTVDESIRHAITKLSHIHFPATEDSKNRIINMGEKKENIYTVGAPGLDYIKNVKYLSKENLFEKFSLKNDKLFILTQHPVTMERDLVKGQITEILESVVEMGIQTVISYPNSDNGGREIIKVIDNYKSKYDFLKVFRNISQIEYLSLLKYADLMIGNSSSGIIEAASFKLPVVNIGTRQEGRLRACNVIDVGYEKEEILKGINKALYQNDFRLRLESCINPYGDGNAAKRIVKHLKEIEINRNLLQKKMTY